MCTSKIWASITRDTFHVANHNSWPRSSSQTAQQGTTTRLGLIICHRDLYAVHTMHQPMCIAQKLCPIFAKTPSGVFSTAKIVTNKQVLAEHAMLALSWWHKWYAIQLDCLTVKNTGFHWLSKSSTPRQYSAQLLCTKSCQTPCLNASNIPSWMVATTWNQHFEIPAMVQCPGDQWSASHLSVVLLSSPAASPQAWKDNFMDATTSLVANNAGKQCTMCHG